MGWSCCKKYDGGLSSMRVWKRTSRHMWSATNKPRRDVPRGVYLYPPLVLLDVSGSLFGEQALQPKHSIENDTMAEIAYYICLLTWLGHLDKNCLVSTTCVRSPWMEVLSLAT